jgi:hypothetical protein
MGMLSVPVPVGILPGENAHVMGVVHYSNGKYAEGLDQKTLRVIDGFCDPLARSIT